MNQMVLLGPQTQTVKYINKPNLQVFEGSDSATEKLSDYEPPNHRRKHQQKKINGAMFEPKTRKSKVVVIETLEQGANHKEIKSQIVDKHKKGKSADIDEFRTNSKQYIRKNNNQNYFLAMDKNREIFSADLMLGVRQRSSITEMKQYNHKKSSIKKNGDESGRQIASIFSGINKKNSKRESKTSRQVKRKQLSSKTSNKSQHSSNSRAIINKQVRPKSKSNQLYTQRKTTKNKQGHGYSDMKFISQTMPLTSKMVNLYSSTTSLLSSNSDYQVYGRGQSFVIPTQQSLEQIVEIRNYESLSLRKRSFENLRKISLINQLSDVVLPQQSTTNIINQYIHLYELQYQRQILNPDLQLSQIPHLNSLRQRNSELNMDNLAISLEMPKNYERQSQKDNLKQEIAEHQQQISKLNQIINIINEKKQSQGVKKQEVIKHLKFFLQQNHEKTQSNKKPQGSKQLQGIQPLVIDITAENKNELSWSDLKQSGTFQQSMQGLNLEILDQTLKEREKYLQKRKERELEIVQQQIPTKGSQWGFKQKERVQKWMDHQIKEVARTRKQLWKGIAFAKNILSTQNSLQDGKKQEMIKCLSEKYLIKSKKRQVKKKSTEVLAKGRISESSSNNASAQKKKKQKQPQQKNHESDSENHELSSKNSDIQIQLSHEDYDQQVDEQLANYSSKFKNEFEEYRKKFQDSKETNQKECLLMEPPTIGSFPLTSPGLNLQKIECELEDEESVNSDEIDALAKQSLKAKQNSIRLPYDLSPEDKQDIFQFLFLDLCIQLSEQYNTDSSLMKKINNFIQKMKQQAKKQKGFKTNTNSIRDYLFQFITHLKNSPQLLQQVHLNLQKPLGPTAADILRYMHVADDEDPPEDEGGETVFILDIKLFQNFEQTYLNTLEFEKYYDDQEKQKKRRIFLKNAIHIHNKAVFDSLNQTLDRERPYGVWGQPFSWKKAAKFHHQRDITTKNNIILKCAQKTIENGAYMCGFMVDKQQSTLKNNPNVTQAYIQQIRDDRLSRLLANQLDQSEEKMLFIDDQQTQILVQVAHFIFQNLLYEVCSFL